MITRPNRKYNKNAPRRREATAPGTSSQLTQRTPVTMSMSTPTVNAQTATFNQPVVVSGTPEFFDTSSPTITVVSVDVLTATTVRINWSAPPTAAITVPFEDPAIRGFAGGYVQSGQVTF